MQQKVLVLGGYGNFGKKIVRALSSDNNIVIINGRNYDKCKTLQQSLKGKKAEIACFDILQDLDAHLEKICPTVVINTCGPFQECNYNVAESCIRYGSHYIDLADAREFVTSITSLDEQAKNKEVSVISGASTVPALSSAVIEEFKHEFSEISSVRFGITPGQKTERGLATVQSVFSYVGKPLKAVAGKNKKIYGWQDIYQQDYPELGKRWMANCDIPDLDLLPEYYKIKTVQFSAGMEVSLLHLGLWCVSWVIRLGIPLNLYRQSIPIMKLSQLFDRFGTDNGGMHVIISGKDHAGQPFTRTWFILAFDGDGPNIPTVPAIRLARQMLEGRFQFSGAMPCVDCISLDDYLAELQDYNIKTVSFSSQENKLA